MRTESCDILIVGSGIAGLSFALHCAEYFRDKKILVLSKGSLEESNTRYAQGGIAAVMDQLQDSYKQHIDDTLLAGDGLCNKEIVELVVTEAPGQMTKLMDWGVDFDRQNHQLELGREGGHSANRILHCKDHTGSSIGSSLLQRVRQSKNITLLENQFVLELTTAGENVNKHCTGALIHNGSQVYRVNAHYTMLASGGAGQLYQLTSNPQIATGDGIALAKQAGAQLADLAFVQFHPTVLYDPSAEKPFLISEAVRGFGAVLRDYSGREFMHRYDSRGSLATRDIVARAIFREMKTADKDHLWLDLCHLNAREFQLKFPSIATRLQAMEIDIQKDLIPILPAAHYFCGGVVTDQWAQTSVPRLLACGECARTGLHGANRLASNSLLEALVFARQGFLKLKDNFQETRFTQQNLTEAREQESVPDLSELRTKLQHTMTRHVGIIRSRKGLKNARHEVDEMLRSLPRTQYSIPARELRNMLMVALAVGFTPTGGEPGRFFQTGFRKKRTPSGYLNQEPERL